MRYRRAPERPTTQRVEAFTVPSGLGGVFTVSIVKKLDDGRVLVRVHSPVHYPDWDGTQFKVKSEVLRPVGKQIIIPLEVGDVRLAG
jgi:hypothetical protein